MPDGTGLCGSCTSNLIEVLRKVPGLLDDLLDTLTRQDRLTDNGHHAHQVDTPLPVRFDVGDAITALSAELTTWADELVRLHGWTVPDPPRRQAHNTTRGPAFPQTTARLELASYAAGFLAQHAAHLRAHPRIGQAHRRITAAIERGWRVVDRPEARLFIGGCPDCAANLYAAVSAGSTRCDQCRAFVTDVPQRWDAALNRLRGYPATAAQIAGSIGDLYGVTVNRLTISQWHSRGEIHKVDEVPLGENGSRMSPRFRIGEVLDRARRSKMRKAS